MEYFEALYRRRIQAEIQSYKYEDDKEDKRHSIKSQDMLILDKISI